MADGIEGTSLPTLPVESGRADLDAWRGRVTDRLLATVAAMGAIALIVAVIQAVAEPRWWSRTAPFMVMYALVLALTLLRGRMGYRLRAWGLLLVGYAAASLYLAMLGLLGNGVVFLVALPVAAWIMLGTRPGMAMAVLSALLYVLFAVAAATGIMTGWLAITDNTLAASQWLSQGLSFGLVLAALMAALAWLGRTQEQVLNRMPETAAEGWGARGELPSGSTELDRYTQWLETVAGIAHEISGVLARDDLLRRAVELLAARLGLHGVVAYLVDPAGGALVAGPGAGAVRGEGRADAGETQAIPDVVADLTRTGQWRPAAGWGVERADISRTGEAGEVALPLHVGERLLGVLYVLSPEKRLTAREVQALSLMADQLAVALDNARLFDEVAARVDELNAQQRQYTAEAWARFVAERPRPEYAWQPTSKPGGEVWQGMLDEARERGPVTGYDEETGQHVLAVPVRLREAVIGVLGFHRPRDAGVWQPEEIAAIEAVSARLAFAAENLRLLEQTQRRVARERVVDQITRQIQASLDPETILKVAAREVGRALGASQALVEVRLPEQSSSVSPVSGSGDGGGEA